MMLAENVRRLALYTGCCLYDMSVCAEQEGCTETIERAEPVLKEVLPKEKQMDL